MLKTKYFLYAGGIIPLVFWITTFICAAMFDDYSHLSGMVSELGALGTDSQTIFTAGLVLCSIMSIVFIIGLLNVCKLTGISIIPVLIIIFYTISIAGAAIFPMPLRLHGILGMPSILLIFSPIMSLIFWRGGKKIPYIKQMSIISIIIMSLGFLVFIPDVLSNYFGLKQRFFHIGWSIWFLYLSYSFVRLPENKK